MCVCVCVLYSDRSVPACDWWDSDCTVNRWTVSPLACVCVFINTECVCVCVCVRDRTPDVKASSASLTFIWDCEQRQRLTPHGVLNNGPVFVVKSSISHV